MIVHIFPKSQFTEEFICFINSHFEKKEHLFILYTNGEFGLPKEVYEVYNVIDYDNKSIFWLYRVFRKAEKLIFHNLSVNIDVLFMIYTNTYLMKKATWLIWGSDLYCYRIPKVSLIDKLIEKMRRKVIQAIPVIASLTEGDFVLAQQWYGVKADSIRLDYCEEHIISLLQNLQNEKSAEKQEIFILIGNSATETNQHEQIFELLMKYKNEKIKLIVPVSYGDHNYADRIENRGRELYGSKFIPVKKYLPKEVYYALLNSIDVAIFNNNRQQATGNITALFYLGKKIYLRDDTSMWDEWTAKTGYKIHNIKDIEREDFSEFVKNPKEEKAVNFELAKEFFDVDNRIKEWKAVFEYKD